jgi:hypothetical protein
MVDTHMLSRRAGRVAAVLGAAATLVMSAAVASARPVSAQRANNTPAKAKGPVGAAGVIVSDYATNSSFGIWLYFKVKASSTVTIHVKNLNGRCGSGSDEDSVTPLVPPGLSGLGYLSGGSITPPARAGAVTSKSDSSDARDTILAARFHFNRGDTNNYRCKMLVTLTPASALITRRASSDVQHLRRLAAD